MKTKIKVHIISRAEQLDKLIQLARKGVMSNTDRELIEYFQGELNNNSFRTYTADYNEIDLDEIPF